MQMKRTGNLRNVNNFMLKICFFLVVDLNEVEDDCCLFFSPTESVVFLDWNEKKEFKEF